ncbi:hypothetical protein ACKWTF_000566 [Chironomus riparius]
MNDDDKYVAGVSDIKAVDKKNIKINLFFIPRILQLFLRYYRFALHYRMQIGHDSTSIFMTTIEDSHFIYFLMHLNANFYFF